MYSQYLFRLIVISCLSRAQQKLVPAMPSIPICCTLYPANQYIDSGFKVYVSESQCSLAEWRVASVVGLVHLHYIIFAVKKLERGSRLTPAVLPSGLTGTGGLEDKTSPVQVGC